MVSAKLESVKLVTKNVLRKPATLAIAVVASAAALIVQSPWPIAAGFVAEAGLIAFYLQNEQSLRRALREERQRIREREAEEMEDVINSLDPESRFKIRSILQLRREITDQAEAPDVASYAEDTLRSSVTQVNSLTDRAVLLAQKRKDLQRYLDRNDEKGILRDIEELQQEVAKATDSVAQAQYQQALNSKTQELEDSRAIQQAAKRIDGQLYAIECSFASLKAKIIRLKTADTTEIRVEWQQVGQELQQLNGEVDTLEKSVNEALAM